MGLLGLSSQHQREGYEGAHGVTSGQPRSHVSGQGRAALLETPRGSVLDTDAAPAEPYWRKPLQGECVSACALYVNSRLEKAVSTNGR